MSSLWLFKLILSFSLWCNFKDLFLFQQSHRRQHNKDKPFKCQNCNRGYTDAASLEVHLSTHTVKHAKLFSCGLCNRSYTSVLSLTFTFGFESAVQYSVSSYLNMKVSPVMLISAFHFPSAIGQRVTLCFTPYSSCLLHSLPKSRRRI